MGLDMYSDGSGCEGIIVPGRRVGLPDHAQDRGRGRSLRAHGAASEVYKYATRQLAESAQSALRDAGLTVDDVDQFVFHQANLRIIESVQHAVRHPRTTRRT